MVLQFLQNSAQAQAGKTDSSFLENAIVYRRATYEATMGANARIYNGSAYKETIIHDYDRGHPYFLSPEWRNGSVTYEGLRYDNVQLIYDLVNNKVLTHQFNTLTKIELILDKIDAFTIENHSFIYASNKDSIGKLLPNGFYDRLENGNASLYVKRKKEVLENLSSDRVIREYIDRNVYYIIVNNAVFAIKTEKDMFKALNSKKADIKARLANEKVKFRNNKEAALIMSVKLYNQL